MFKFDEICELIRLVGSTEVSSVEIEHAGSRLRIEGQTAAALPAAPPAASSPVAVSSPVGQQDAVAPAPAAAAPAAAPEEDANVHVVRSPIVGTFYRAPNPDADPYVRSGDFVEKGQILCIVEAMKLMNEIECDASGTIVKIFQENAQPVEYGQPLFALRID